MGKLPIKICNMITFRNIFQHISKLTLTVCEIEPFKTFGAFHLSICNHGIGCKQKEKAQL